MVTDQARTKAHFFLDTVKKEIRKISTSVTPKTENGNSTVAYPILMVRGSDNSLFNKVKEHMLKYDKYMTCEDRRSGGYLMFKFKVNDETENFLFSQGEQNSNTNDQENANNITLTVDPKSRLDSLKSLLRKAGLKSGLHCSDVKFANDEALTKCVATVYNCSKLQGERTMYYLLECGFSAHVGSKPSVTLVDLPNVDDYSVYFKEEIGADCFPPRTKIEEEQRTAKGGTEDSVSDGKPGEVKVTDITNAVQGSQVPSPTVVVPQQSVASVVVEPVIPESIAVPNSAQMQMARLAYEQLSGAEKVAFLHEYGKSLIPDEEEIVARRKPIWEKQYASQFEDELRNTMADEVFQNAEATAKERLTPILRNALRPEVLDEAKKNAFNHMKDLLTRKFKSKYSIVPADGTWKIRTAHNGTVIIESTVSIDELMKEIDLKNVVA